MNNENLLHVELLDQAEKEIEHLKKAYDELADRLRKRDEENAHMITCVRFYAEKEKENPICGLARETLKKLEE